jgi:ring-1,2-phenylacetyl-CoA epoxidase subunit PaaD
VVTPAGIDVGALLASVPDPELPFLTIEDLGILRGYFVYGSMARVQITPTYSGCPALDTIREDVEKVLRDHGFDDVEVETVLSPAWTTDWLSERGKAALAEHGIAPPGPVLVPLGLRPRELTCPQCGSLDTEVLSRFGATACKALYRCRTCREPFEHLKAH